MKTKLLFFGGFLFCILFLLPMISVNADPSHELAVSEGDEFIYTAKVVDDNELEDIYGVNWDTLFFFSGLEAGATMRVNFTHIDNDWVLNTHPAFLYRMDVYEWSTDPSSDVKQSANEGHYYYQDIADYVTNMYFTHIISFCFPTPIEDALGDYDDIFMPDVYTFVDNLIIVECYNGDLNALEHVRWLAEYNEKGVPSSIKIFNKDNDLIVDIELGVSDSSIPGFELGIMLMAILIPSITLLLRIQRKRKK